MGAHDSPRLQKSRKEQISIPDPINSSQGVESFVATFNPNHMAEWAEKRVPEKGGEGGSRQNNKSPIFNHHSYDLVFSVLVPSCYPCHQVETELVTYTQGLEYHLVQSL